MTNRSFERGLRAHNVAWVFASAAAGVAIATCANDPHASPSAAPNPTVTNNINASAQVRAVATRFPGAIAPAAVQQLNASDAGGDGRLAGCIKGHGRVSESASTGVRITEHTSGVAVRFALEGETPSKLALVSGYAFYPGAALSGGDIIHRPDAWVTKTLSSSPTSRLVKSFATRSMSAGPRGFASWRIPLSSSTNTERLGCACDGRRSSTPTAKPKSAFLPSKGARSIRARGHPGTAPLPRPGPARALSSSRGPTTGFATQPSSIRTGPPRLPWVLPASVMPWRPSRFPPATASMVAPVHPRDPSAGFSSSGALVGALPRSQQPARPRFRALHRDLRDDGLDGGLPWCAHRNAHPGRPRWANSYRGGRGLGFVGRLAVRSTPEQLSGAVNTTDIYDPTTGTFASSEAVDSGAPPPPTMAARFYHTATTLDDGRILLAGGATDVGGPLTPLATADIFNPSAPWVTPLPQAKGNLQIARFGHTAVLLPNGNVLIAGGIAGPVG